eukprot:gb/GECG01012339.1/.p1 GENE.gb/GECG01012339.1/~~gb/GECG01012339.1/.p1  ORF type:complete len:198 (+),score=35.18 gb/GECG01012339.1/:1-594(+)
MTTMNRTKMSSSTEADTRTSVHGSHTLEDAEGLTTADGHVSVSVEPQYESAANEDRDVLLSRPQEASEAEGDEGKLAMMQPPWHQVENVAEDRSSEPIEEEEEQDPDKYDTATAEQTETDRPPPGWFTKLGQALLKWHLPLLLILAVVIGASAPNPGAAVSEKTPLSLICIIIIFFLNGIQLDTEQVKDALSSVKGE